MSIVTSIALLPGVVGVIVEPELTPSPPAHSVVSSPVTDGPLGPAGVDAHQRSRTQHTAVHPSLIPKLAGKALLNQLSLLDHSQLVEFGSEHSAAIQQLISSPPAATQTEKWWSGLPTHVRQDLRDTTPELVGNLPGVPSATRDSANRLLLRTTVQTLKEQLAGDIWSGRAADDWARLSMLSEVERALTSEPGQPARQLRVLDTRSPGRAAIVIGDLTTADFVSYLVPGMLFSVEGQIVDWSDSAAELYDEQSSWLELLSVADTELRGKTVATVAWMGYHTPNLLTVGSPELANEGAHYLNSAIDALYAEREASRPSVSVIAHSYGSTAAMKALSTGAFSVDSLVAVGSPGSEAQSVDDLHVRGRNVFVGEANWDPVVGTAFFGSNPGDPSYGARRMSVTGGVDLITRAALDGSIGHNEYFAPGSESLRNMALIGIGRGSLATDGSDLDVQRTMAYFDDLA